MRTMLLLVHGLPATGKTTLAQWLSRELGWPAIHKDAIKEILWLSGNCRELGEYQG